MSDLKGIKAVIFDWAGTTVDYGCLAPTKVFIDVFKSEGIEITNTEVRGPMGRAKFDHVKELCKLNSVREQWMDRFGYFPSEADEVKLYKKIEPAMASLAEKYAVPIKGTIELQRELKYQNIKIGSTTGYVDSIMKNVMATAASYGYTPDTVVTSSDVIAGRPAPYMCYLNALRLQVYPLNQIVKIGDTVADIQEGLNAGMWTIGITQTGNEVGFGEKEIRKIYKPEIKRRITAAELKLKDAGAHFIVEGIWDCLSVLEQIALRIRKGEVPLPAISF